MFFKSTTEFDTTPICLVDTSGSTAAPFESQTVLQKEIKIMQQMMVERQVKEYTLVGWNTTATFFEDPATMTPSGGTSIEYALALITDQMLQDALGNPKPFTDIYVFTDGEINGNTQIATKYLTDLLQKNVNMYIVSVEPRAHNYLTHPTNAGNALFALIKSNNLTSKVKSFVCYNPTHKAGFYNLQNITVPDGCAPFQSQLFKLADLGKFVDFVENLVTTMMGDHDRLVKLTHDLAQTMFYVCKGKSETIKKQLIAIITNVFATTSVATQMKEMLQVEMSNIAVGKASTYHEYRLQRNKSIEQVQIKLFENVKQNVDASGTCTRWMSVPLQTDQLTQYVLTSDSTSVNHALRIYGKSFLNSCIKFGEYTVPMLPMQPASTSQEQDAIRQWIRTVYSYKHRKGFNSEMLLYLYLCDTLSMHFSTLGEEASAMKSHANTMMQNVRSFEMTDYAYYMKNRPSDYMLNKCLVYMGLIPHDQDFATPQVATLRNQLWYGMCFTVDPVLAHTQYQLQMQAQAAATTAVTAAAAAAASTAMESYTEESIMTTLQGLVPKMTVFAATHNAQVYTCHVNGTQLDTTTDMVYLLEPHKLSTNAKCPATVALSQTAYDAIKTTDFVCPVCNASKNQTCFMQLEPEPESTTSTTAFKIIEDICSIPFEMLETPFALMTSSTTSANDTSLLKLDDLNLGFVAYETRYPILHDTLNQKFVTMKTSDKFKYRLESQYSFMKNVDMTNVCLAGGLCRSLLLGQKPKDFDFFFYGSGADYSPQNTLQRVMTQIMTNAKTIPNVKFLIMHKPIFNVCEVIMIEDPKDFLGSSFTLDFYDKYKFKSLNKFDRYTVIDPVKGTIRTQSELFADMVEPTSDMFKNYFEDGDGSGVKMLHRLQFIMAKFDSISDVLANFDLPACKVAFDGTNVLFTEASQYAYKYMVNLVSEHEYSALFDHRLSKYMSYGFSIGLPELAIDKVSTELKLSQFKCKIIKKDVEHNVLFAEHDSNNEDQIQNVLKLERQCKADSAVLYKSCLFSSLVSIMRYVKINELSYLITTEPPTFVDNKVDFKNKTEEFRFIDKICSRISSVDWYGDMRREIKDPEDYTAKHYDEISKTINVMKPTQRISVYQAMHTVSGYAFVYNHPVYGLLFNGRGAKNLCKAYMARNNQTYLFQILIENKRNFKGFTSAREAYDLLCKFPERERCFYEVIDSSKPCKPHLDIEWYVKTFDVASVNVHRQLIPQTVTKMFADRYKIAIAPQSVVLLESHSPEHGKISFHVVVDTPQHHVFATNVKQPQHSAYDLCFALSNASFKCDDQIYTRDREFRTVFSTKCASQYRPFTLATNRFLKCESADGFALFERSLVTHHAETQVLIQTPMLPQAKTRAAMRRMTTKRIAKTQPVAVMTAPVPTAVQQKTKYPLTTAVPAVPHTTPVPTPKAPTILTTAPVPTTVSTPKAPTQASKIMSS
jgi:hypothetical protein